MAGNARLAAVQALLQVHRDQGYSNVVLDNLLKGAAGQAVQNMNLLFGLPENMGLPTAALCP